MTNARNRFPSEAARYLEHARRTSAWRRSRRSWAASAAGAFVWRHRVAGCGVLLLTLVAGYMVSRPAAPEEPRAIIREAAERYGVPEDLIAAVIEAESQFNPRAVSRRGAQGLMQLMPSTAATLGVEDPFSPRENIDGGVRHLRTLIDRFDNNLPLALAAYNAGEVAVRQHKGIPPYRETRAYVRKIMSRLERNGAVAVRISTNAHDTPRSTAVLR
jgi:soluble lytic murein transglycosylase-like protein